MMYLTEQPAESIPGTHRKRALASSAEAGVFLAALLVGCAGCSDSSSPSSERDARVASHPSSHGVPDATAPDAGRRIKLRTVAVTLPPVATRDVSVGADGNPAFGELQPLEGASVCVAQRRDAFAAFKPFEPVAPPICSTSIVGQQVRLEGVPANSDLVITVEYDGLRPLALTSQTGNDDVPVGWASGYYLVLFKPGATDPWLEPPPPPAQDHGVLLTALTDFWLGAGHARPELVRVTDLYNGVNSAFPFAYMPGVDETVDPAGGGDAIESTTLSRLRVQSLPAGSTRIHFAIDNQHLTNCVSSGLYFGLPASTDGSLEMPVLAGHDQIVALTCICGGSAATDVLTDLSTCTFADSGVADAGADAAP